jgi:uncharacterized protein YbjQ (UPF0145 family)
MKNAILVVAISLLLSSTASARNTISAYSVNDALAHAKAESVLGSSFKFYFSEQKYGTVLKKLGEIRTNKKTNAFNKTDTEACQWVFLSAMKALKDRAIQMGGNAVVNIRSNYKDHVTHNNDSFQCGAGAVIAGVALIGDVVKIEE